MNLRRILLPLLATICLAKAFARQPVGAVYWDLDHLYDTVPALFYDDTDYTPEGRLHWETERYTRKIRAVSAVIDSMRMPLVALWSVENENVVRDIAAACKGGYSYLHRTLNALDGMDFALLYYGDTFFPCDDEAGRRYLYVEGALRRDDGSRDTLGLVLCSDVRMAAWVVADLREERPHVKLLVMGRLPETGMQAYGLHDATARSARAGRGNLRTRAGWRMRDRILADTALHTTRGDVFARRYLVDEKEGFPIPTYFRMRYTGGCSYALPVFTYIR